MPFMTPFGNASPLVFAWSQCRAPNCRLNYRSWRVLRNLSFACMHLHRSRHPGSLPLFALVFLLIIFAEFVSGGSPDSTLTVTITSPLKLTVSQGGGVVRHSVLLKNTGTEKVEWRVSSNQAWLKFEPASG